MPLDLRKIQFALTVAEFRSFSRAAEHLGLTQPTLTRNIQSLERDISAKIFDRSRAGVIPTPMGQLLLEKGAMLAGSAQDLQRDLELMRGHETGRVAIGTGPYPAAISVGAAVSQFVARYPRLEIEVSVSDWISLRELVLETRLDLAIAELSGAADDERFEIEAFAPHVALLFVRREHPLAKNRNPTLQEVMNFPLVSTVLPTRMRSLSRGDRPLPRVGDIVVPTVRVNTMGMVIDVVRDSDAVGIATAMQLLDDVENGAFAVIPLHLPFLRSNYGIIRLRGRTPSPAAEVFMAIAARADARAHRMNEAARRRIASRMDVENLR